MVVRPLDELDLRDELRRDPDDVALAHAAAASAPDRTAARRVERTQQREQPLDLLVVEARADVADVAELVLPSSNTPSRSAPKRARAPALSPRVAADHELLAVRRLDLHPVARPPAGLVARVPRLGHDPLEALLLRRLEQRLAVVEGLRELHVLDALVEQPVEPLPPLRQREADHRLAVDLEHVERDEDVPSCPPCPAASRRRSRDRARRARTPRRRARRSACAAPCRSTSRRRRSAPSGRSRCG